MKFTLIAILITGLAGLSYYMNKDSFAPETIQINHRMSPWMRPANSSARRANDLGVPVTFTLNGFHSLTTVKVIPVTEIETNKFPHAVWKLVSDSNSVPTSSFNYGSYIKGMRPDVKGARPDRLQPGVAYRLIVGTAKDKQAQHDFTINTNR